MYEHVLRKTFDEIELHMSGAELSRFWYLATPYTRYPMGRPRAFTDTARVAGSLLAAGVNVFAPIVHGHVLATAAKNLKNDHEFWMAVNAPFMEPAIGVIVAQLPGWQDSIGIKAELAYFSEAKKPIVYLPV
jgi:hypothetical protein